MMFTKAWGITTVENKKGKKIKSKTKDSKNFSFVVSLGVKTFNEIQK